MATYSYYPNNSIHARATARWLSAELAEDGRTADYLIFQQGSDEGLVDPWSFEYFRTRGRKRGHTVIYMPSYLALCGEWVNGGSMPDWVHILDPTCQRDYLAKLADLKRRIPGINLRNWQTHGLAQVKQLFLKAVGASNEDEIQAALGPDGVANHFRGLHAEVVRHLLASKECDDFYYLLALVSHSHADQSHDLNRVDPCLLTSLAKEIPVAGTVQLPIETLEALGRQSLAKIVLGVAETLREAMQAPPLRSVDGVFRIFVIDDDKFGQNGLPSYSSLLCEIAKAFFPSGSQVCYWNPLQDVELFHRLCRYKSIDADPSQYAFQVGVWNIGSRDVSPVIQQLSLADLASDFQFILVDQLYKQPTDSELSTYGGKGRGENRGPALIRGLKRALHDLTSHTEETGPLPQIVALSRDDDPARIQDALRSGARDYILKTQLLRLPAVLSKAQHSIGEGEDSHHRNFPELYKLPSETLGLLRTVRIPCGRSLHRSSVVPQAGQNASYVEHEFSRLLHKIPKSDLHVHAGSCMSPEFLIVSSAIGLTFGLSREVSRGTEDGELKVVAEFVEDVVKVASVFRMLTGYQPLENWSWKPSAMLPGQGDGASASISPGAKWLTSLGRIVRDDLVVRLQNSGRELAEPTGWKTYQQLRAFMHAELAIRDRLSLGEAIERVSKMTDIDSAFFGVRFALGLSRGDGCHVERLWSKDDLIRIYLLTLATCETYKASLKIQADNDFLETFRGPILDSTAKQNAHEAWLWFLKSFYPSGSSISSFSTESYRGSGWRLPPEAPIFRLTLTPPSLVEDFAESNLSFDSAPIEYSLSTGLRSTNLVEYLEGCEFSGAEHLRHPFLIHLYAQQVVVDMLLKGVFYVELRAAPDGYINSALEFEFPDVCRCLEVAFGHAQQVTLFAYRSAEPSAAGTGTWVAEVLGGRYCWNEVSKLLSYSRSGRYLPCKISMIYVGKRHKATREMILEAAAVAVMRASGEYPSRTASEFVDREFSRCRVVGFDLAGKEVGNPPERFVEDFSRLSRLHIPLTVHAGENESAQFVEDSILKLRAKRIGHGLSLIEDRGLMVRVREDVVGIELCPISNFQTSHFGEPAVGRPYPLRKLLEAGILVSINTDNPIISCTNMVREFFQASYAWGPPGMPLWEALRLVRMGYIMSFLNLPERRALLEIVGQFLYDLFCEETTVEVLRNLVPQKGDTYSHSLEPEDSRSSRA